jgi:hypothetical protein
MNQIVGTNKDGTPFLALELEPGNLHRLRKGDPILLRIEDSFPDGIPKRLELLISFSETPQASARKLAEKSEVTIDERSSVTKQPHCPECRSTIEQIGVWRNESPIALTFCAICGCVFGMVPNEMVRDLKPA